MGQKIYLGSVVVKVAAKGLASELCLTVAELTKRQTRRGSIVVYSYFEIIFSLV